MKHYIYLTILLVCFGVCSFFNNLFIIPLCLNFVAISLLMLKDLLFSKTRLESLEKRVAELNNAVTAIRFVGNHATRKPPTI